MKTLALVAIIAFAAASCTKAATTTSPKPGVRVSVVDVQDGDSLLVEVDGIEERVRLIGVNAPEHDECFGQESAAGLRSLIDDREVQIVTDVEAEDQYGRLLAYVYRDGILINEEIALRGLALARAYEPNTELQGRIDAAAQDARENQRGMWSPATCASQSGASVTVAEIEPNPPGPDGGNLNGEWVVIANTGDSMIDLTGWILRDASSVHRYLFRAGTSIASGSDLVVHTGCGDDDARRRYWCEDGPVWDNTGDTALLLDADGRMTATFDY